MLQVWAANSFLLFKVFQDLLVRYGKKRPTLCARMCGYPITNILFINLKSKCYEKIIF